MISLGRDLPSPSCRHTRTGSGATSGTAICRSCWGMTTIRSGSMPRRRRPRHAASCGDIAHAGSSCSRLFVTRSDHRQCSTSSTSRRSIPSWATSINARRSPPISPAHDTSRHRRRRRAVRSRTSRNARRNRRAASGKSTDIWNGMMARLDVASAVH